MYEEFYGLSRRPFENTPNPEFFFASKQHREGLAALIYGIKQCKGFMLVTGEVGSGKTFLIQSLKYELEEENHIILEVATPWITPEELFAELPAKLGMDMDPEWGSLVFQSRLKEQLERLHAEGRRVLVVLDEAQQLPERTLEGIRLLSNFENEDAKLIQIIFLGQNELNDKLARYSMRQIRQRITLSRSLGYFNETETRRYVEHRLSISGCKNSPFDDDSLALIFRHSHGSPRLINLICDNCLITGYAHFSKHIHAGIVQEVVADLPSVQSGTAYSYDQESPADVTDDNPAQVVAESVVQTERAPAETESKQPAEQAELSTAERLASYYPEDDYDDSDTDPVRETGGRSIWQRAGLWVLLIATVALSWFAARWYEDRNREGEVAEQQEKAPAPVTRMAEEPLKPVAMADKPAADGGTESVVNAAPVSVAQSQGSDALTWDTDPALAGASDTPVVQGDVRPEPAAQPAVANAAPQDLSTLSMFERLRIEANVADVRKQPTPHSEAPVESHTPSVSQGASQQVAREPEAAPPVSAKPVSIKTEDKGKPSDKATVPSVVVISPARKPDLNDAGKALIEVPEGIVVSKTKPASYESGKQLKYPFEEKAYTLQKRVPFVAGETVSQMARGVYGTWNDTVQDMVRGLNPALRKDMDKVTVRYLNLPPITREDLLVHEDDLGWYAFTGTVTSRLKANHLYESFKALEQPAELVVTRNHKRRIYRVYMGPYQSRKKALNALNTLELTHMPYLQN